MHPKEDLEDYILTFSDSEKLMKVLMKSVESGEKDIKMILTGEMDSRKEKIKKDFKINKYT
jgi:hypothetical protein